VEEIKKEGGKVSEENNQRIIKPKIKKKISEEINEEKRRLVKIIKDNEQVIIQTGKQYEIKKKSIELDLVKLEKLIRKVCQQISEDPEEYLEACINYVNEATDRHVRKKVEEIKKEGGKVSEENNQRSNNKDKEHLSGFQPEKVDEEHDQRKKELSQINGKPIHDLDVNEFADNWLKKQRDSVKRIRNPKKRKNLSEKIDEEKITLVKIIKDNEEMMIQRGKRSEIKKKSISDNMLRLEKLIIYVCQELREDPECYLDTFSKYIEIVSKKALDGMTKKVQEIKMKMKVEEMDTLETEKEKTVPDELVSLQQMENSLDGMTKTVQELKITMNKSKTEKEIKELIEFTSQQEKELEGLRKKIQKMKLEEMDRSEISKEKSEVDDFVEAEKREKNLKKRKKKCNRPECGNKGRHRCSRCKTVKYCQQDCLTLHWSEHRHDCNEAVKRGEEVD